MKEQMEKQKMKFKALTKKEKREHIWEYYRFHIIGIILGVFFISQMLITIFGPKPPESTANVLIIGKYIHDEEVIDNFKSEIENIIENDEGGKVEVDTFAVDWNQESEMTMAMNQKLMLMFQAKEIDVLIMEEEKFDSYVMNIEDSMFEVLEEKPSLSETLEKNQDSLFKRKFTADTDEKVYGLLVKDNIKLQSIGLGDDFIVSIPVMTNKMDNAVKTIEWLYE